MKRLVVSQGIALARVGTARDGAGAAMVGFYTGTEPLAGVVWAGDDRAPLLSWTPAWADAPGGTYYIALTPAQTAALEVGTYSLSVRLADGSGELIRCLLEVEPSAGLAAPLFSYVTFQQMTTFSGGQIRRLQDDDDDETGFAEQRNQASLEFDALVLARYRPVPGRSRRYVAPDGTAPGPYRAFAPGPGGAAAPTRAEVAALLGTAAVIPNADIIECVARLALALVYLHAPGRDNPYREQGNAERQLALQAFRRALVEIDIDGDGVADVRLDQDACWLV
jgi:hypothetical protein